MGDSHAVDIESLARQLREELAAADSPAAPLASGCPIVIAQVGELTRNVDPPEYEPQHVAIGPYHRSTSPHLARDDEKLRCLATVMATAETAGRATLEAYLDEVARLQARARCCYAHAFAMDSGGGEAQAPSPAMEAVAVVRDALYLADNQIPFFVVDTVHRLTVPDAGVAAA
ncbi:unnamed protein product, partial [Urochloa humidicola]